MGEWQDIATAPKDDRDVLIFCPQGVCTKVFVAFNSGVGGWETPEGGEIERISGRPSHWMPLPDPPR